MAHVRANMMGGVMCVRTQICRLLPALLAILSGCSTIYVGNVPFTTVEICTEELASRLHPHSGCLPPTRAEHAQRFFLARFRLEVSPDEAQNLIDPAANGRPANQLPSWIGRVFRPVSDQAADGNLVWKAPETGNMEFSAIGDVGAPPERSIATEILINTDISGVVQKKLALGAELNPAEVVDRALGAVGAAGIPPGLRDALVEKVAKLGYERNGFDAGKGSYYYVSMTPRNLDSLTSAVSICGWDIRQKPGDQHAGSEALVQELAKGPGAAAHVDDCTRRLAANASIAPEVKALVAAIQAAAAARSDVNVVGVVIGVAILHTDRGMSELCTKTDLGLLSSGATQQVATESCTELRTLLTTYVESGTVRPPDAAGRAPAAAPTLSDEQKKSLLIALTAEYSRAAYKSLALHPHTSVLAIHWIPAWVRGPSGN
jgi:hypothetical protein